MIYQFKPQFICAECSQNVCLCRSKSCGRQRHSQRLSGGICDRCFEKRMMVEEERLTGFSFRRLRQRCAEINKENERNASV